MRPLRAVSRSFALAAVLGVTGCRAHESTTSAPPTDSATVTGDAARHGTRVPPTTVPMHTNDGWTLDGDLYQGLGPVGVVLVHQLGSSRHEWAPLISFLQGGMHPLPVLAVDLRGHGDSTNGPGGPTDWQSFGNDTARWGGTVNDVRAAVQSIETQLPEVHGVVLVGSSIGSSASLREAANDPSVVAVVMLSPGVDYRGMDTTEPLRRVLTSRRPVFALASVGDTGSADTVRQFESIAAQLGTDAGAGSLATMLFEGTGAHGVSIGAMGVHPELWTRVDSWIRDVIEHSPPTGMHGAPAH